MSSRARKDATISLCADAAQNTDAPKKSRRWVDFLRSFEATLALPWINRRRPYIALYVARHGFEVSHGRYRMVAWIQFMWGRRFSTSGGGSHVWNPRGRWSA